MNAINHPEAQAIHAAASAAPAVLLEAADPRQESDSGSAVAAGIAPYGPQRAQDPAHVDSRTRRQHPACRPAAKPDRDRDR
jgi:hypothetical protein